MNICYKIKKVLYKFLFLIISIFLISCEFQPTEDFVVDLDKPSDTPPPIAVNLNLLTDTAYVYWASPIKLSINTGIRRVIDVVFTLDGVKRPASFDGMDYSFTVFFYDQVAHKIKVTIITNSGTSSIADMVNAEGYVYESREWTLIGKPFEPSENISYTIDENSLTLSWKKYNGLNFKQYKLVDNSTKNTFTTNTEEFNYQTYCGQPCYFDVFVVDDKNEETLWGRCNINKQLPILKLGSNNNDVTLELIKNQFSQNIAEYQIFMRSTNSEWIHIGTYPETTTSIVLPKNQNTFAPSMGFYVHCVPKNYVSIDNSSVFYSYLYWVYVALPGPVFYSYRKIVEDGFYFDEYSSEYNTSFLYKHSSVTNQTTRILDFSYGTDISPNGKSLIYQNSEGIDLYDLSTNTKVHSINIKQVIAGLYYAGYPKVSDNGICTLISNDSLYAFNLNTEQKIYAKKVIQGSVKISADGQYVSVIRQDSMLLYKVSSNSIDFLSKIKHNNGVFYWQSDFCPNEPDKIYSFEEPNIVIRSCEDLSVVKTINIGQTFYNIDFYKKMILSSNGNGSRVFNLHDYNTGSLIRSINYELNGGAPNYVLLNNNTIYYTGYRYHLNEK